MARTPAPQLARVAIALVAVALLSAALLGGTSSASGPVAVPRAHCGPGSLPETSTQGRVPRADYTSGRAAKGYRCNAVQVGHQGRSGGFKTIRYVDTAGHVCAFYDYSLTLPRDVLGQTLAGAATGVQVLDMSNPARPVRTAVLSSLAMQQPHESLLVNQRRGILAAVMGTLATAPGIVDLYDVRTDCRHPKLLSTSPLGILGHESGFAPDGRTFYAAGVAGNVTALDVSDPRLPKIVATVQGVVWHGLRLSADGRTMYAANIGKPGPGGLGGGGLQIVDVSSIQDRKPSPKFRVLSSVTWPQLSIPQVAEPFTRNGRRYVLEVDEFVDLFSLKGLTDLTHSPVGAARIIDVQDRLHPRVVSDIRLAVHQPSQRGTAQKNDPGAAFPAQGYAAHYCSIPTQTNPKLAACSMILSGLRVFDIRDVAHPKEVAYFNKPAIPGSQLPTVPLVEGGYAMSQPAWDTARKSIWYTDANSGFYVVRLTNAAAKLF